MESEAWWERAARVRRANRVSLKQIASPLGKTTSWAGHLMAGPGPGHERQVEEWVTISSLVLGDIDRGLIYRISGDYLVIDPDNHKPEQGEIVVAGVIGVEVAKLFYRFGESMEASLGFETVIVRPGDEFEIVGTYVAAVRPARGTTRNGSRK